MKPLRFRLSNWISRNYTTCRHNLSSSGLEEPDLSEFGINTSYEDFRTVEYEAYDSFRDRVASVYGIRRENVLPTVGGSEAIFLVSAYLQEHSGTIHVPVPEYEPVFEAPESLGMKVVTGSMDEIMNSLSGNDAIAFTSPNNPTGRAVDGEALSEMLEMREKKGLNIYVDETFREFIFENPIKTLSSVHEGVISSGTMTKFYGIGNLRVGWISAPEDVIKQLRMIKDLVTVNNTAYSLWIAEQILSSRMKFVKRAKDRIQANRKIVEEYLENIPGVRWSNPDSAPFGFVEYESRIESARLAEMAMERYGILISPGEFFGREYGFRLCFTTPRDDLLSSMEALAKFLKGLI